MAGIIQDAAAPPQPAAPPAAPPNPTQSGNDPTQSGVDSEQPNVSPDEQKIYDTVVTGALNFLYSDAGFPSTIQKLGSFKDRPAFGIGHTAAMVLMSVKKSATQGGKTIPDDILFAAGQEVVGDLVEIARGIGIITAEQSQTIGEEAFYEGMKVWGQNMQDKGEITPEMQQQAKADLEASGHKLPEQGAQPPQAAAPQQTPPTGIVNQAGAM